MNKKELTELAKQVASHYGENLKCKWLDPYGYEWVDTEMEVNGHFISELEKGCIKDVQLHTDTLEVLKKATEPLIKYLCENHYPGVVAIVTSTSVEIMKTGISVKNINKL